MRPNQVHVTRAIVFILLAMPFWTGTLADFWAISRGGSLQQVHSFGILPWFEARRPGVADSYWTFGIKPFYLAALVLITSILAGFFARLFRVMMTAADLRDRCRVCGYRISKHTAICSECGSQHTAPVPEWLARAILPIHYQLLVANALMLTVSGIMFWAVLIMNWRDLAPIKIFGQSRGTGLMNTQIVVVVALLSVLCGGYYYARYKRHIA